MIVSDTDNFLSFLLSIKNFDLNTLLLVFLLTLARIVPIVSLAPFLAAKAIRATIRMLFAVTFCMLFVPQNLLLIHTQLLFNASFIGYLCKEIVIGSILGFLVTIPFLIATGAGALIDHTRGSSALQVTDPTTTAQSSDIGVLYNSVLIVLFFALNGPILFFDALARSYQLLPIDGLIGTTFFNINSSFWTQLISLLQHIMDLTIRLSAPALIGMFLTDLFLGIANRLAPQVQVVFLGIPLKSWVGIALMTAAWTLILQVMGKEAIQWVNMMNQAITQASQHLLVVAP